jgi:hypothetical protein
MSPATLRPTPPSSARTCATTATAPSRARPTARPTPSAPWPPTSSSWPAPSDTSASLWSAATEGARRVPRRPRPSGNRHPPGLPGHLPDAGHMGRHARHQRHHRLPPLPHGPASRHRRTAHRRQPGRLLRPLPRRVGDRPVRHPRRHPRRNTLKMPTTVLQQDWGPDISADPAKRWRRWAPDLEHHVVNSSHFRAEQDPDIVTAAVRSLLTTPGTQ